MLIQCYQLLLHDFAWLLGLAVKAIRTQSSKGVIDLGIGSVELTVCDIKYFY